MRLIILIPSAEYLSNAGARIRYVRLSEALARNGIEMSFAPIDAFNPLEAACEIVMVSKCYDARALVAAAALSRRGIMVGVDLFDDYFSQATDSRLSRYRVWLRQMLSLSDFALCSTPVLARTIEDYGTGVPILVLSDSAPGFDRQQLAELLERKLAETGSNGVAKACWFGIGDNPYFPVGLSDLAAFGGFLATLARNGMPVELTVLTNRRALEGDELAKIAKLSVSVTVEEWSEERESEILAQSLLCFLPVSAQAFSIAKSLNRALTAICAGCQILSVGYPLYAELNEWIYREPEDLIRDFQAGQMRLSPASVHALEARIAETSSSDRAARSLAEFLEEVSKRGRTHEPGGGPIALLHGCGTSQVAHAAVKQAGGISVGTPFCTMPLDFDAIVELGPSGATGLLVAQALVPKLRPQRRGQGVVQRVGRRKFAQLFGDEEFVRDGDFSFSLPLQLALYDRVFEQASSMLADAFGEGVILLSEDSPLPLEPAV